MIKKNSSGSGILKAIIYTNICFFIISLLVSGSNLKLSLHPFTALTPSTKSLILLGASGTIPINNYHEWWSLITANFLHGSLLHILFNMLALNQVASTVSTVYGKYRMFVIFIISGIAGFFLSYLAGIEVTIGASASVCGLIGAILYYGKSRGGILGETIYKQMLGWVIFIVLFGILIPNINNWGHGGGLVSGIILGWLLSYNEKLKENKLHKIMAFGLMGLTLCILIWSLLFCYLILT
ncbi:MAG: rhomboid family intramembrane serine protease [Desulfobacteraceae bacterium]|nr:rhomboid family intramembrane serine protease [Desulfobacteraceae bacterium]